MKRKSETKLRCEGIEALLALYGYCEPEDFEPECIACKASVFVRDMIEMQAEAFEEAPTAKVKALFDRAKVAVKAQKERQGTTELPPMNATEAEEFLARIR